MQCLLFGISLSFFYNPIRITSNLLKLEQEIHGEKYEVTEVNLKKIEAREFYWLAFFEQNYCQLKEVILQHIWGENSLDWV